MILVTQRRGCIRHSDSDAWRLGHIETLTHRDGGHIARMTHRDGDTQRRGHIETGTHRAAKTW